MGHGKREHAYDEIQNPTAWYYAPIERHDMQPTMRYIAEAIASFFFALLVLGFDLEMNSLAAINASGLFQDLFAVSRFPLTAFVYGAALIGVCAAFGHMSCDLNPVVTIVKVLLRRNNLMTGLYTLLSGCVGWMLAALVLRFTVEREDIEAIIPSISASNGEAFLFEFLATWILVMVALLNGRRPGGLIGLGLALATGMLITLRKSGGSLNPSRIFAPVFISFRFPTDIWYLFGAQVLAIFAAWAFLMLPFGKVKDKCCPKCHATPCECRTTVPMQQMYHNQC